MSGRVLIAVNLGIASEELVRAGLSLAHSLAAQPYLLYTYLFPPPSPSSLYPAASRALYEQAMLDLRRLARDAGQPLDDHQLLVRSGPAARLIVDVARELEASLIVVGSQRLRGLERLLVGSTAESVAREATCPVLLIPSAPAGSRRAVAQAG